MRMCAVVMTSWSRPTQQFDWTPSRTELQSLTRHHCVESYKHSTHMLG